MLLSLRSDHKEHLSLLTNQPAQIVVDFCKLAVDFLQNGSNMKLYTTAANKLSVPPEVVQNCIYGVLNLLLISCKHKLTDADFRDSVLTLGFSQEQQTVLSKFYKSKQKDITEILNKLSVSEPHFHDMEWRFEVLVASRSLLHQVNPLITMDISLKTPNKDQEEDVKHVLLQTDPMNLAHITAELERALHESRSQHSQRIQRAFIN